MIDENLDVFGRARLYIYRAILGNIGISGDLQAVRTEASEKTSRGVADTDGVALVAERSQDSA